MYPEPHTPRAKAEVNDPEFEADVARFIDAVLEDEKKTFQPGIESFQIHANRIRQNLRHLMHEFQENFTNGYRAICEGLEAQGKARPIVDEERLALFDDPEELMDAIESGREIYQLLGFTPEQMMQFYEIGGKLADENTLSKARDVFSFLVTIAPELYAFWLGLGKCQAHLGNFDASLDAFSRALELNPQRSGAYLGCTHVYVKNGAASEAIKLCEQGLTLALANRGEIWADELSSLLTEAKQHITSTYVTHH